MSFADGYNVYCSSNRLFGVIDIKSEKMKHNIKFPTIEEQLIDSERNRVVDNLNKNKLNHNSPRCKLLLKLNENKLKQSLEFKKMSKKKY